MSTTQTKQIEDQVRMIDAKTIAQQFGVTPATVARWHRNHEMPQAVRVNRRIVRWREDDVTAWIEQRKATSNQ